MGHFLRSSGSLFSPSNRAEVTLLACLWLGAAVARATLVVQIGQNFTGSTYGTDSSAQPADANGAAGLSHFVEFINGRFSVYAKNSGSRVQTMTDVAFWESAGVPISSTLQVTDPRVVFDPYSQRWFASMVDFSVASRRQHANRFLLAISNGSNPTGPWQAIAFTADPVNGYFADFPTLGVDTNGVYLSGDMFDRFNNSVGPTLLAIPKTGLLSTPPDIAGLTSFGVLSYTDRGSILQPAMTTGAASPGGFVLAAGDLGYDSKPHTTIMASTIQDAGNPNNAVLGSSTALSVPPYVIANDPTQPDGSTNLDDGDARISAIVRRVGDVAYAVHGFQYSQHAAIRWYKLDAVTPAVIQTGFISDPNLDLFYPSIAANDAGLVVISYNGSSKTQFVSCYAVAGETVGSQLQFGTPILLKAGTASYNSPDSTGYSRWGDYSATSLDPANPNHFWTIQMYPSGASRWRTQISEIIVTPLELTIATSSDGVSVSWPAGAGGFALQTSPTVLPTPTWSTVSQTPTVVGNQNTVLLPAADNLAFFRLIQQAPQQPQ